MFFALEGSRSYGIGLTRALAAAGMPVIEVVRSARDNRRRKGKTDRIDAGLAVLAALRMDVDRLPAPRSDGYREALRILLGARDEIATTRARYVNRLRALLLTGDDTDRTAARGALTTALLDGLTRQRPRRAEGHEGLVRRAEIRRLAHAIRQADRE